MEKFGNNGDVYASESEYENGYEYEINDDGVSCTIIGWSGDETELIIPGELGGYKVTCIGNGSFEYCINLTSCICRMFIFVKYQNS